MNRLDRLKELAGEEAAPAMSPRQQRLQQMQQEHLADRESRRAQLQAQYEAETPSPLEGMSTADKFWVGVGSGMTSIAQGAGNLLGIIDDETIAERKDIDNPISDTTAGSVGQFVGETAALLPLGFIGKGAQGAHTALKARAVLPTAQRILGSRGATVAAENMLAGAIAANPGERLEGAAVSGAFGHALHKAMGGFSRFGVRGSAKMSDAAEELSDLVQKKTGKRPFIPLTQAADVHAGPVTAKTKAWMDAISMLPSARAKFVNQADDLMMDLYETNIRQAFGGNKADIAAKVLRETGDLQMALEAGKNAAKGVGRFTPTQEILDTAARMSPVKGKYTARHLIRASEKSVPGDIAYAPLRQTANLMDEVTSLPVGTSNVAARDVYHTLGNLLGAVVDAVPTLGPMLGSRPLQNFLLGNTYWQRALKRAVETGSGQAVRDVMSGIRRAMAVQPVMSDGDMPVEGYVDQASRAAEALRNY